VKIKKKRKKKKKKGRGKRLPWGKPSSTSAVEIITLSGSNLYRHL
jgi:hypothetical protein